MLTYHFPPFSALSLVVKDGFTHSLPWRRRPSCPTLLVLIGMAARCRYEFATMWNEQRTASLLVDAVDSILIRRLCRVQRPTRQGPERLARFRIGMGVRWSRCRLDSVAMECGRLSFSIPVFVRETYRDLQPPSTGSVLSKPTHPTQNIPSRRR